MYTLDRERPWAEAVAIEDGRIAAVGSDEEIGALRGEGPTLDLGGRLVLPGFADAHVHFLGGSLGLDQLDLSGAKDLAEIQARLAAYAKGRPGKGWILGRGWNYAMFPPARRPTKADLDGLFPQRPVLLASTHLAWANSEALRLAGLGGSAGVVEGERERFARAMPPPTREEKLAALRAGLREAARRGLTRVHSAGGDFEELELYEELERRGELSLRLYAALLVKPPGLRAEDVERLEAARKKYQGDRLAAGAAKFLLDGIVESRSAALLEPYAGAEEKGRLYWDPERFESAVAELDRRGFQLFSHAIGDGAVRAALDAYEKAARRNGPRERRHRVEHVETCAAEDLPRFGRLGVVASMQPRHALPDEDTLKVWAPALGRDRAQRGFAWRSISKQGGRLAFGTDWPVVPLNPWPGVQAAVTRQTPEGEPKGGWVPEERLTLEQAVEAYTLGAAYAGRREATEGSLERGKAADLIVLSRNVFEMDPREIGNTEVLLTVAGGRIVHQAEAW